MSSRHQTTEKQRLQRIAHEYMKEFRVTSIDLDEVAQWAIDTGRWEEYKPSPLRKCRRALAAALGGEIIVDSEGREVRAMHPYPVKKHDQYVWEWSPIYSMKREKFRASMTHRRDKVLGSLKQMKIDHESWNDHNVHGATLPLFPADFTDDLAEMDQPEDHWPEEDPDSSES